MEKKKKKKKEKKQEKEDEQNRNFHVWLYSEVFRVDLAI